MAVEAKSIRGSVYAEALDASRFSISIVEGGPGVRESQKLRYNIFALEQGAELHTRTPGIDDDGYDPHCHHLLIRDQETGQLAASTRVLMSCNAIGAGGFYSEAEFQLDGLLDLAGTKMEIGRTCVHPEHRNGAVIGLLWQGLAEFIRSNNVDYVFGCASIPWGADGAMAHAVMDRLRRRYMAENELRVVPRLPMPSAAGYDKVSALKIPPLLKAYVSLGAMICGEPCWDPAFRVADVFVLLDVDRLESRYARHFGLG